MTKRIHIPLTALAALCLANTACQTTQQKKPDHFAQADTNHDGKLSVEEVNTYIVTIVFNARDVNHDGKLTLKEWSVEGVEGREKLFRERDANHDGIVTIEEATAHVRKKGMAAETMKAADTNKDGFLTRQEAKAYQAKAEGPAH
jgi:Ca2+-binding EF-hand superfamily protein